MRDGGTSLKGKGVSNMCHLDDRIFWLILLTLLLKLLSVNL
jgi:hypothetical protein